MVVCGATTDILTATATTTIVDLVPSCIPQLSRRGPRDSDTSGTFMYCSEASGSLMQLERVETVNVYIKWICILINYKSICSMVTFAQCSGHKGQTE